MLTKLIIGYLVLILSTISIPTLIILAIYYRDIWLIVYAAAVWFFGRTIFKMLITP